MGSHKRGSDHSPNDDRRDGDAKYRKHKHHHHKEKKHRRKDDDLVKEAKAYLKREMDSKSQSLVPVREVSVKISDDDYFIRNPELSVWLRDEKNIFFSDIDTATAKVHFSEFVRLWNAGRLPDKYYIGTAANTVQRTGYAWSFKGAPPSVDRSARGLAASGADEEDALRAARRQVQVDRSDAFKRSRTREREWLDEVAPKATGREATIEKKIAAREERRMAADSPERARLDGGGSIMGGGDSFAAAKAREAAARARRAARGAVRQEELGSRVAAAQRAEDAKVAQLKALVAAAGGKITIPRRE